MPTSDEIRQMVRSLIIRRHQIDQERYPNCRHKDVVVLKTGGRVYKAASLTSIYDHATGDHHHDDLALESVKPSTDGTVVFGPDKHVIRLSNEHTDEIGMLADFLASYRRLPLPSTPGQYMVTPVDSFDEAERLEQIVAASRSGNAADILASVLDAIQHDPHAVHALANLDGRYADAARGLAAALRLETYRDVIVRFRQLIDSAAHESAFQRMLEDHPWLFGSEYSADIPAVDRDAWSNKQQVDFMMRRTADGYVEIIEIKRAQIDSPLFSYDKSRDCYYPGRDVSSAVGQVISYIANIEANFYQIQHRYGESVHKIRAKIIIGRSGSGREMEALRLFNGHLHRIEILTYDQLMSIAGRTVAHLQDDSDAEMAA